MTHHSAVGTRGGVALDGAVGSRSGVACVNHFDDWGGSLMNAKLGCNDRRFWWVGKSEIA